MKWLIWFIFIIPLPLLSAQNFTFSGDKMNFNQRSGETVLEGNVQVIWDNLILTAQRITIMGQDNKILQAEGSVILYDKKNQTSLRSRQLRYNSTTKLVQAVGNVEVEYPQDNLSVRSGFLRYDEENKLWDFESQVTFKGEDFAGRGERMRYDETTFLLELEGDAQINRDDESFKAQFMTIHTKNKDLQMKGSISGVIRRE
jgi:lipopolysaccharide export system protein LptA